MRQQLNCERITVAVLIAVLFAPVCRAQDWSGNGLGNNPMPPAGPMSPADFGRSAVPAPPTQPATAERPLSWPDGSLMPQQPPAANLVPIGPMQFCQNARIIARIGGEAILQSDVAARVNEIIEQNKDRIPPEQIEAAREALMQTPLKGLIETKLICQDLKRELKPEQIDAFRKQIGDHFEAEALEAVMKANGVTTRREFDEKLRTLGSTLDREKQAYIERSMAQEWARQQIKRDEEVTLADMAEYYQAHKGEFTTPARAQWDEITVRFSNPKYPTKDAARDAIARMGNAVFSGVSFAEVAKNGSDGFEAPQGGRRDWTSQSSLESQELDRALFGLRVGELSPIIESSTGYHIIRVVAREPAVVKPFDQAQAEIKTKITNERSTKRLRDYLAKLEARTPVWTIFDKRETSK